MRPMTTIERVVATTAGDVRGDIADGIAVFKGIPYAAAPFGPLRFAAPAPPGRWGGVRDALDYGPTSPKAPYRKPIDELLPEPSIAGEDILNLNIWTPETGAARLPVFVWIHGGAFTNGSGAVPIYDGTAFARDGVVCVTINYRLGAEGFALLDDAPANRGLLDQVAALRWVRENIAKFGGDPDKVTIAGESAGAISAASLIAMPGAEGLFARAVMQSGSGHYGMRPATAKKVAAALADSLGVAPTVQGLGSVSVTDLVVAQTRLTDRLMQERDPAQWGEVALDGMAFQPCIDGSVLPERSIERIMAGAGAGVSVMIGSNADEGRFFFVPRGQDKLMNEDAVRMAFDAWGLDPGEAMVRYRSAQPDATPGELFMAAWRDYAFSIPAVRVAEARAAHDADTFVYEFDWRSPVLDGRLGAAHMMEISFVFDRLQDPAGWPMTGETAPQALANEMHRAWVEFASSGDPGWSAYGSRRMVKRFGQPSNVFADPAADLRALWEGVR